MIRLPGFLPTELSLVLGTFIANRLPTPEARPWRKALMPLDKPGGPALAGGQIPPRVAKAPWPIESVLFAYPGKHTYGPGELIFWELKLMGQHADHGLFLELILPAMEEAASTADPQWRRQNHAWGQFDIHAVYAARGKRWEPVVKEGALDLHYRATPGQWAEGLSWEAPAERIFDTLTWLTPFDLGSGDSWRKRIPANETPGLWGLLDALLERLGQLLPGKYTTAEDFWALLDQEEQEQLQEAMGQAALIPLRHQSLTAAKRRPGRWIGKQHFPSIPGSLIPYLELASILHIGKQTHFGCGTFVIT